MQHYFIGLIAALAGSATQAADTLAVPSMKEQAGAAGIEHQYTGPFEHFVGGGAASLDCNGDRFPDLFLAGGTSPAQLFINKSKSGGMLEFETGALPGPEILGAVGAYPINLDNDAHPDLVVLRIGENLLLRGGPDCSFTNANAEFSFDGGDDWSTGFSAKWEAGEEFPTLAFGNYIDQDAPDAPWGTCADNRVVRSAGMSAQFSESIPLLPSYCSLSLMFTDWNNNDQFDLRITNDRQYYRGGQEQLWTVAIGEDPVAFSDQDGWQQLVIWGMGIAQADLTGDGRPEYALTSMGDTMLQSLEQPTSGQRPSYTDIAFSKGATAHRPYQGDDLNPSTGWHSQFIDANNDGHTDLYIAKGNVEFMPDFAAIDPDNLLLGTGDGGFAERGGVAGIDLPRRGRGAVWSDMNADGLLDLLVVNREEPTSLFRNQGAIDDGAALGNFLSIELQNGGINPNGIGAKIEVSTPQGTQTQTVQIGGGHASGQLGMAHFGLGSADMAQVRVKWPHSGWSEPYTVNGNQFVILTKGNSQAEYWVAN